MSDEVDPTFRLRESVTVEGMGIPLAGLAPQGVSRPVSYTHLTSRTTIRAWWHTGGWAEKSAKPERRHQGNAESL